MTDRARVICLPAPVANQIAAGEVVTRPSSVVKELVENAIDAEATRIAVDIDGGGVTRIRVVDDGIGMVRDDATRALQRHATSKIRRAEDLLTIRSFGFRGEALPSIASVSRFRLRTRPADEEEGTEVTLEGGVNLDVGPCGAAPGTTVEVEDLFFNVPARRKFLRATSTESAHVGDALKAIALAHPRIQFDITRDGRRRHRWLSAPKRRERVQNIFESYPLHEASGDRGPVSVEGYLSTPDRARTGAGGLYLFVRDRPVQDRALARAVATAYGPALDPGRYPVGAVFLDVDPTLVDVNVHPQKTEVRFAHARAVADALHGVVADALGVRCSGSSRAPAWSRSAPAPAPAPWTWPPPPPPPATSASTPMARPSPPPLTVADGGTSPTSATVDVSAATTTMSSSPSWPARGPRQPSGSSTVETPTPAGEARVRVLGVVRDHVVVADEEGVRFVSRRRARHAWLLMRARTELESGGLVAQRLLFPLSRQTTVAEGDRLAVAGEEARWLGCEIRRVDTDQITVGALPRIFAAMPHEPLVDALIAALLRGGDVAPALEALCVEAADVWPEHDEDESRVRALVHALAHADELAATITLSVTHRQLDG